jgi:hypothetical protein
MYKDVGTELVKAGLAVKLDTLIYVDKKGVEVEEEKSMGMKMQTQLQHPDMCIVMDKTGYNINMTKEGHVNGT